MTEQKQAELLHEIDVMLDNPALAQFIYDHSNGEKVMHIEAVKGLLLAAAIETERAMSKIVEMIKNS